MLRAPRAIGRLADLLPRPRSPSHTSPNPRSGASSSSRSRPELQVSPGRAGAAVQAAVSIVSPPGTRLCLGTVGRAAAPGVPGPPPGNGEAGCSRRGAARGRAWPVLARRRDDSEDGGTATLGARVSLTRPARPLDPYLRRSPSVCLSRTW